MTDNGPSGRAAGDAFPYLDVLLKDALPEIKLALGDLIDRENARTLPTKFAQLIPETLLVVTLRPDAAEAVAPIATALERELTDSCTRHGSLYDRAYRVQLRRSEDEGAPLYQVAAFAGQQLPDAPHVDLPSVEADRGSAAPPRPLPLADPESTRIASEAGPPGWEPGRWVLVVNHEGEEREAFRLGETLTTVGRKTENPELSTSIAISDAPHVSRRQLALLWEERDGAPGFRLYNLGLNPLHLAGREVPGAHVGRGTLQLDQVPEQSVTWLPPGVTFRIGEHGPDLRIDEVPRDEEDEEWEDPDATRFG